MNNFSYLVGHASLKPEWAPVQSIDQVARWDLQVEGTVLVLRDKLASTDCRFAFFPTCGIQKNYGNLNKADEKKVCQIHTFGDSGWIITEESDVLCFRYLNARGDDNRYAFYPNSNRDYGEPTEFPPVGKTRTLWQGQRWSIKEEAGVFVLRDTKAQMDSRHAFFTGNYMNM